MEPDQERELAASPCYIELYGNGVRLRHKNVA
jgi:hypothetical protein